MFLVNWSLGLLFKRIIRSLEKLIVVRVWVSSKRWVRSHVVTGGFFGKLEIFAIDIMIGHKYVWKYWQILTNMFEKYWQICVKNYDRYWQICVKNTDHACCCPKLTSHGGNLVGGKEKAFAAFRWQHDEVMMWILWISGGGGRCWSCKNFTCFTNFTWQFHSETVWNMCRGLGRNFHDFDFHD